MALSSCEAEIIALSEAAKDMVYLRKFVSGMTGKQPGGPSVLRTDNKAARDLSYNPEMHNRTKHVESFELNVPLISTLNNYADFFTKTLKPGSFSSMRNTIMNTRHNNPVSSDYGGPLESETHCTIIIASLHVVLVS